MHVRVRLVAVAASAVVLSAAFDATAASAASPPGLVHGVDGHARDELGSRPADFTPVGHRLFFTAHDELHGRELWVTAGTPRRTRRVADVCPGRCDARIRALTAVGDEVFFFADASGSGAIAADLWRSDGTARGTRRVARLCDAPACIAPGWLAEVAGGLLFTGQDAEHGPELWASDGTAEGTGLLVDVCAGACSGAPDEPVVLDGVAYFLAVDADHGAELWRSDGTAAGTSLVADVCPGACSSVPGELTAFAGEVYFAAAGPGGQVELWASDGTAAGTRQVADVHGGFSGLPFRLTVFGGRLWFLTGGPLGSVRAFSTDGATVAPAPELFPRGLDDQPAFLHPSAADLYLVFIEGLRWELWATSGPGDAAERLFTGRFVGPFAGVGERLLFAGLDADGDRLWESDGTPAGTRVLHEVTVDSGGFGRLDEDLLVFAGVDARSSELWRTDGTAGGTRRLADLHRARRASAPEELVRFAEGVAFLAAAGGDERPLWHATRGGGVRRITTGLRPARLTVVGRLLFFVDASLATGHGPLHVTGGLPGDVPLLTPGTIARDLVAHDDRLFFVGGDVGQQLWTSDGSEVGTRLLVDVAPGWVDGPCGIPHCFPAEPRPRELTSTTGDLFFVAGPDDAELWASDGTAAGTRAVVGFGDLSPRRLTAAGDRVFFRVGDFDAAALWVSDGTAAGTTLLTEATAAGAEPLHLLGTAGGHLFFAVTGTHEDVLWTSDGTVAGTVPVVGLGGRVTADPAATAGARLVFVVDTVDAGIEPWSSDGTAAGTGPVDVAAGVHGSGAHDLTALSGRRVVLTAGDLAAGAEAWIGDGRRLRRLFDLAPGRDASDPAGFTQVGSCLYFTADDGTTGRELWVVDLAGSPAAAPGGACR